MTHDISPGNLHLLLLCLLPGLYLMYTNIRYNRIQNLITFPILLFAMVSAYYDSRLGDSLAGMAAAFVLLLVLYIMNYAGAGIVKLGAALGAWFGLIGALYLVASALIIAAIWHLIQYGQNMHRLKDGYEPGDEDESRLQIPGGAILICVAWFIWIGRVLG